MGWQLSVLGNVDQIAAECFFDQGDGSKRKVLRPAEPFAYFRVLFSGHPGQVRFGEAFLLQNGVDSFRNPVGAFRLFAKTNGNGLEQLLK